jgi:hypothetical protein
MKRLAPLLLAVTLYLTNGEIVRGYKATLNQAGTHYQIDYCERYHEGRSGKINTGWCVDYGPSLTISADKVSKVEGDLTMERATSSCFLSAVWGDRQ